MWVINILCAIAMNTMFSKCFKYSFSKALPITCLLLIGMLFMLSVFNALQWIDYISVIILALFIVFSIRNKSFNAEDFAQITLLLIITVTLYFCCKGHVAHHSDELNYWGLETKTIFFLNGFSEKGKDAAYLYSDYHPGLVLFMWWFCHLSPYSFSEGLMYTGYWTIFAIPIISIIGSKATFKKMPLLYIFLVITILIVPSSVNGLNYESITAELPMASFFALLMFELFSDTDDEAIVFYSSALTLTLVLLKKSGLVWAIIALFIGFIRRKNRKLLIVPITCGLIFSAIWKTYCLIMERNSYFSTDVVETIEEIKWGGIMPFIMESGKYAKSYFQAFISEPLHTSSSGIINITPIVFCVVALTLLLLAIHKKFIQRRDGIILIGSYIALQILFFVVVIVMCTFIFREYQYYNSNHMVNHFISRYGIPFYVSALLMSIFALSSGWSGFSKKYKYLIVVSVTLFIGLSADWNTIKRTIIQSDYYCNTRLQIQTEFEREYKDILSNNEDILVVAEDKKNDSEIERYYIRYFVAPKQILF